MLEQSCGAQALYLLGKKKEKKKIKNQLIIEKAMIVQAAAVTILHTRQDRIDKKKLPDLHLQ